jgi:glycosyltransferase involved in cell wall biosynthesis
VGGIERLAGLVVPELSRHGVNVLVIANTDDTGFTEGALDGVPFVRIPSRRAFAARDLSLVAKCKRRIAEVKADFCPDIVHVHLSDPSVHFHLTTVEPASRTVVTLHSHLFADRDLTATDTLFARAVADADAVTAVTASALPVGLRASPRSGGPIAAVIPNGIPLGSEPSPPPAGPPVLLAVGRLVEKKAIDVLIRAYARCRARSYGARLRVVGDGPERDALGRLADDLGVYVEFTGSLPARDVSKEYGQAALVVLPSRREGQPLVAIEAAAFGRPVVGSHIAGTSDVVVGGITGTLVPVDDPDALAGAIDTLLADPDAMARLGAAARRRAVDEYSLEVCVDRYMAVYRTLLNQGHQL